MTEWERLGRPESYRALSAQPRRRLGPGDYLDAGKRYPIVGPADVERALAALQQAPPATYLSGMSRLALLVRHKGLPMPVCLASTPTPTAALVALTEARSRHTKHLRECGSGRGEDEENKEASQPKVERPHPVHPSPGGPGNSAEHNDRLATHNASAVPQRTGGRETG